MFGIWILLGFLGIAFFSLFSAKKSSAARDHVQGELEKEKALRDASSSYNTASGYGSAGQ
ncbi:hypothetical protein [Deinococcus roseus]|uniref:Uncharacterized protein n=1 Tax=Deinococcus roseus TaxID=392414 RepID=A0ABQ2DGI2_9DEIO|nr:hypothetical protein [Deinococcus roseus]GGJ57168.1 hypothetical protein GCM10008938_49080 [Deinococcus roseus]